jgi:hypothetical protein
VSAPALAFPPVRLSAKPPTVWRLVFQQELHEMWAGGRVLNFLAIYGVLMSVTA